MNNASYTNDTVTQPSYTCFFNEEKRYASIVIYFITLVIGLVGNILVLVVVVGRRTRRTENDIFIANLALSDLALLLFFLPVKLYAFLTCNFQVHFAAFCNLILPMSSLTFSTSIFTMTAMSVHRCRHIVNPFMAPARRIYTYIWIALIWALSITLILPLMVLTKLDPKLRLCQTHFKNMEKVYTVTLFVLQCVIPLCIISGAYFLIWRDLSKSRTHRASVNKRGQVVTNSSSRENKQVVKTIATIVILFVICTFPTQLAWMAKDFGDTKAKEIALIIFKFSDILGIFNSCLNPIVYGSLTKHFRYGYYRYLCYVCLVCTTKVRSRNDYPDKMQSDCDNRFRKSRDTKKDMRLKQLGTRDDSGRGSTRITDVNDINDISSI